MEVHEKVAQVFGELAREREGELAGRRHAWGLQQTLSGALAHSYGGGETANEIAFHLTDWLGDGAFLVALALRPELFTPEEIDGGVRKFLTHVPNHVAAAAKLAGYPIKDLFGVGPLVEDVTLDEGE